MKQLTLILGFITFSMPSFSQTKEFKDPRDGKVYKTIKIGKKRWFAQNLAFKPNSGKYWAYNNNEEGMDVYGYLYDAKTALKACPTGWHVATEREWTSMQFSVGDKYNNGDHLEVAKFVKAKSGWKKNRNGSDESKLGFVPGGLYDGTKFYSRGYYAFYWALNNDPNSGSTIIIDGKGTMINAMIRLGPDKSGMAVRCVKD